MEIPCTVTVLVLMLQHFIRPNPIAVVIMNVSVHHIPHVHVHLVPSHDFSPCPRNGSLVFLLVERHSSTKGYSIRLLHLHN